MGSQVRFTFTHAYLGLFLISLMGFPFFIVAILHKHEFIPMDFWVRAGMQSLAIVGLLLYTAHRCSTERLTYHYGLLVMANSVIGGTINFSIILGFPLLLLGITHSIICSLTGDLTHRPDFARKNFNKLVKYFYDHRLHQG